jgi:(S)-mandelate dehydrogenase
MPRFVLEYLEGGAEEESSLLRDRTAFAQWRFTPRQLVDVSHRTLRTRLLGRDAPLPLVVSPTGLNALFWPHADTALAAAAASRDIPFVQSTMSNDTVDDVARVKGLRHWWQLYVFGGDEVWQELLRRVEAAGCEALVLTTDAQIFGNREWSTRTQATASRPSLPTMLETLRHPRWLASTLLTQGMPVFRNVIDFVPRDRGEFFESAFWIRAHQPTSLSWRTVAKIRERWKRPLILKGILNLEDVRRSLDSGVDGIVLGTHGGRQLDACVSGVDLLPAARGIVRDRIALYLSGGVRRGTDILKACALGADAVWAGRAALYGVGAAGEAGAHRALEILEKEAFDALGLLGAASVAHLPNGFLVPASPRAMTRLRAEGNEAGSSRECTHTYPELP